MEVKIKLLTEKARMPEKKSAGAAAWDLYWAGGPFHAELYPQQCATLTTGLSVELPQGYEAQIRGRSGMSADGLLVAQGTIDSDYRGEIRVIIWNISQESQRIFVGDRIAQLVVQKLPEITLVQADELSETERGIKGFGSTGR